MAADLDKNPATRSTGAEEWIAGRGGRHGTNRRGNMRPSLTARGLTMAMALPETRGCICGCTMIALAIVCSNAAVQRRLSRPLTPSGPADCKGATPANILVIAGTVPTAALAISASGPGPLRVKKQASPIETSITVRVASVGAADRPATLWASVAHSLLLCA